MQVYRLSREKFALPLSGKGAAIKGARWNSPGTELIYTAINRSLAMAEVAVHFTLATLPEDYVKMSINIPDHIPMQTLTPDALPPNWKTFPHPQSTQKIGDEFVQFNKHAVLIIPSVITQGDFNVLINPKHSDFKEIEVTEIEAFPWDRRILTNK